MPGSTGKRWQHGFVLLAFSSGLFLGVSLPSLAAEPPPIPEAEEVRGLLAEQPFTQETWPAWRARLLDWIGDRSHRAEAAFEAAREFSRQQAGADGDLAPWLARDAFAWYLLGSARLYEQQQPNSAPNTISEAERDFRRSIQLDAGFARAHRNLALALIVQALKAPQVAPAQPNPEARIKEIRAELETAGRLDPDLPLSFERGLYQYSKHDFQNSERLFRQAMTEQPGEVGPAQWAARAASSRQSLDGGRTWTDAIEPLAASFPDDGELHAHLALALARDGRFVESRREIDEARRRGFDAYAFFGPQALQQVMGAARRQSLWRYAGWGAAGFAAAYLAAMALMAISGLILAGRTRGAKAVSLLGRPTEEWVHFGQVVRSGGESLLARLYMAALMAGLIMFYVAVPFLAAGLLAATGGLLYFILMLPRIPIKLLVIVIVVGLGMAWAVLKSVFTSAGSSAFGRLKTADDCPRLHETVREVAQRVDTAPVDEIYLAPGSSIGVRQDGRGPFGMFGVKRRVLTLGMSTMRYLTISELKAILAHEYGHFSHKDTFYSRFIYQVTASIEQALDGMGRAGGQLNYVNPFFWCLYGYYRAYSLLAAGFSRSREFLADRMAVSLYGKDAFVSGLTKVAADGALFESTMFASASSLLAENKSFSNVYEAFDKFRSDEPGGQEREKLYQKLLEEEGSLFASHPTLSERVEAILPFPDAPQQETAAALELFEQPEEIEQELTEFLTGYVAHLRALQAVAAAT
jgi:Zn-dependent protease with chaperone function